MSDSSSKDIITILMALLFMGINAISSMRNKKKKQNVKQKPYFDTESQQNEDEYEEKILQTQVGDGQFVSTLPDEYDFTPEAEGEWIQKSIEEGRTATKNEDLSRKYIPNKSKNNRINLKQAIIYSEIITPKYLK